MSRWSIHAKYCNIVIKQLCGLKTWSRCRGSIVACPALYKHNPVYSVHKGNFNGGVYSCSGAAAGQAQGFKQVS